MRKESALLCAVLLTVLIPSTSAAAIRYNVTDLGTLPGYESSRAWSINNKGKIVGEVFDFNNLYRIRAILFDPNGAGNNIDLGTLGGENSWAASINNNAQIVGADSNDPQQSPRPTIFDPNGGGNNIGLGEKGSAHSINDNGQIVGYVGNVGDCSAVLFDPTGLGDNVDLGTLDGTLHSVAYSTNNSGQIVGYAFNDLIMKDFHATLFDPSGQGNNIDLGTLGGEYSWAVSINANGKIVGRSSIAPNPYPESYWLEHATLFDSNDANKNIDLGTLDKSDGSVAVYINNKDQIVGQAWDSQHNYPTNLRAVLFDPNRGGNNVDLNSLINPATYWTLMAATCINDNGSIVGFGNNPNGDYRAFLLTPATPGDLEPDRDVDLRDFAIFAAAWRSTPADNNWNPFCDISEPEDGSIDESDLALFADNYLMQSP